MSKQVETEIDALKAALESHPEDHDTRVRLANKYFGRNMIDEAMAEMQKLIDMDTDPARRAMTYFNLGVGHGAKGMMAEALVMFKNSLELKPNNPLTNYYLGCAYLSTGMADEAESAFQKVLEIDPENRAAYDSLGYLYVSCGRSADAERIATKLVELFPQDALVLANAGSCFIGTGKIEEGLSVLQTAVQIDPNEPHIHKHLAIAYEKKGMKEEAAKAEERYKELAGVELDAPESAENMAMEGGR